MIMKWNDRSSSLSFSLTSKSNKKESKKENTQRRDQLWQSNVNIPIDAAVPLMDF